MLLLVGVLPAHASTNLSAWAFPGVTGRILQQPDALGNRVLDYSMVGYKNGTAPIPDVPVKLTISPVAGDDGANLQNAINSVKAMPLDASGFRGAVLLTAGQYEISNSITIDASGIVLRGAGDGPDGTILRATGTNQRTLVFLSGSGSASTVSGTTHNLTNAYVPVGARSFLVDSTSGLSVGDRVYVRRIATDPWIHDLGMDLLCCPPDVNPWTPSGYQIDSDRVITRIEGSRIMIDAPLTCAIEAGYAGGTIRKFTWTGRINNVGIENIRGDSDYVSSTDESHGWTFIALDRVENAWVRRVTSEHFGYACVQLGFGTRTTTVRDCQSLHPISQITGSRRYAFVMDDCSLCLVQNCYTLQDRHQFVTQSLTTGPNVFVDGLSDTAYSDAGPHHRWGTGALWDNVTVNGNNLNIQNRGNLGSGHGWAGANEVAWNCAANGFVVQNPPTARNWLIGNLGPIRNGTVYVGPHAPGTYDLSGSNVFPHSLYYAQLQDRLAAPAVQTREYWIGEINQFTNANPAGTAVPVDAAWRSQIQSVPFAGPLNGFDLVTNEQIVPFTFNFALGATDRLVGASLAIAMRAFQSSTNDVLFLDSTNQAFRFYQLGWNQIGTGTNTTVAVLDLGDQLHLLADGKLNLAVAEAVGIDWAMLELQVAPAQTSVTNSRLPRADASVRGGANANLNYGTNSALEVKADSSADNQRQAYLRWNLAGYSTRLQHARVRLTPVSVGTNGLQHGIALANRSDWGESAIIWNNQPGGGKRFATWIPSPDGTVEFVVTPQVQAALAGDGQFALELFSLSNVGGPGLASYASREDADPSRRPQLLLVYSNALPVVSEIEDQVIPVNTNTGPLAFSLGDPVYAVNLLSLGAVSSNTNLVPNTSIVLGGALSNRTVAVTPFPGQTGTAWITLIVTNPAGLTAGSQFSLTVTNGNGGGDGPAQPASGSWIVDASGLWNDPANWSGGLIATGVSQTATFALDATGPRYVNNDSPRIIGNLTINDTNPGSPASWFVTNNSLTLQVSNGTPKLAVSNTTATIRSVLGGTQGLSVAGNGVLVLAGANTYAGTTSISSGALRAASDNALGSPGASTSIGNDPTARLELSGDVTLPEPITVSCKQSAYGNVPAIVNVAGTNTLSGTLSLTTGGSFWTFESAAGKLRITGNAVNTTTSNVRSLWLRGAAEGEWLGSIGDSAAALGTAIRKDDTGTWILSGNNSFTGSVVLSNGTLLINGRMRGPVSAYGGTFGGAGTVAAPVNIYSGATLSPGASLGTLAISNTLALASGSFTRVELAAQTQTCDRVTGLSNVIYAGTLEVTNIAGFLAGGQDYQLFSAASASGNFQLISPSVPGQNLAWSFNPSSGILSVIALPPPQITRTGFDPATGLALSGTGPTGSPYRVLATTNLLLPLSDWSVLDAGVFTTGEFEFVDLEITNHSQRYYRIATP